MKTYMTVCLFLLCISSALSQKKMITLGATGVANDIINSNALGYNVQFEQQFDNRWTFSVAFSFCSDTVNNVSSLFVNGIEKSSFTKYKNTNAGLEIVFRYYFQEAMNGLYIGPAFSIHNFDIIRAFNNNGDLGTVKKKGTAVGFGFATGATLKLAERFRFNISGFVGQGFIGAPGYRNNLIVTGNTGIGFLISNKKPKPYWQ